MFCRFLSEKGVLIEAGGKEALKDFIGFGDDGYQFSTSSNAGWFSRFIRRERCECVCGPFLNTDTL